MLNRRAIRSPFACAGRSRHLAFNETHRPARLPTGGQSGNTCQKTRKKTLCRHKRGGYFDELQMSRRSLRRFDR